MLHNTRRYDIDWIRVIAIALLLIYHVAIAFQPWGIMIGFITSKQSWGSLWIPMTMLNVWRIPLLFFVSGMGVYFALQNRNWKSLMAERSRRILLPFVFGSLLIVPIHQYLWQSYNNLDHTFFPNPGHLWFLGNIFVYILLFTPVFFYIKKTENGKFVGGIRKLLAHPLGVLFVIGVMIAEAVLVDPRPYELYAMTWHGFFLGMAAFLLGFCFVLSKGFWEMMLRWRWIFLAAATGLFILRLIQFQQFAPNYLIATESVMWILTVLAFGHRHLNRGGKVLSYLSEAAYPVYIIHMVFLSVGSYLIFKVNIPVQLQFVLVLIFTFGGCLLFYELVIRRVNIIRVLFGLKWKKTPAQPMVAQSMYSASSDRQH